MDIESDVVVIGGGQAGLSVSYYLGQRGISHVVLDRHEPGWAWAQQRWDSFCLVTPNWQCRLPDFAYSGPDPHGFMGKDDIVDYLKAFAEFVDPPLRNGVTVSAVERIAGGWWRVVTDEDVYLARNVIVAIGANHIPVTVPEVAVQLPQDVLQLHAMSYRNPQALPDGDVLIIGTGQSGCQIAEDCHLAGRRVHLAVGSAPKSPRRYRGRDVVDWLDELGHYALTVDEHPLGKGAAAKTNHYVTGRGGGHEIDLRAFFLEGMGLYGRLEGISGGDILFGDDLSSNLDRADGSALKIRNMIDQWIADQGIDAPVEPDYLPPWQPEHDHPRSLTLDGIGSVIWCMGFRPNFGFIKSDIFDDRGIPNHHRGVTSEVGLAFVGLPWQHTWGSGRFASVGADAAHVVDSLFSRSAPCPYSVPDAC